MSVAARRSTHTISKNYVHLSKVPYELYCARRFCRLSAVFHCVTAGWRIERIRFHPFVCVCRLLTNIIFLSPGRALSSIKIYVFIYVHFSKKIPRAISRARTQSCKQHSGQHTTERACVACRPEITTAVPFAFARFGATAKELCEYMCCDEERI